MSKLLIITLVFVLLIGCVSGYYCINIEEDNNGVLEFKQKINYLALKADIENHNLTEKAFYTKLKYFGPCR